MKKISTSKKNWRELSNLRNDLGFSHVNEAITMLLDNYVKHCKKNTENLEEKTISKNEWLDRYDDVSKQINRFLEEN